MNKKTFVIGITGTFGSGKSTVSRLLGRKSKAKIIDADDLAHEVFKKASPVGKKIKVALGLTGVLRRGAVAKIVFSDSKKLKVLELLIHPYVLKRIKAEIQKRRSGVILLEVPLLFETGFDALCDTTIAVVAGRQSIKRLKEKGFSERQISARQKAQFSEAAKKKAACFSVNNSFSQKELEQEIRILWDHLVTKFKLKKEKRVN